MQAAVNYSFLATCDAADVAFEIPVAAAAQALVARWRQAAGKAWGRSRSQLELGVPQVMQAQEHLDPELQGGFAQMIAVLCLTSGMPEANPAHRAFQLEISRSEAPSWVGVSLTFQTQGSRPQVGGGRWFAHYRSFGAKAELDEVTVAHRRTGGRP